MTKITAPTPIKGYAAPSAQKIDMVNDNKDIEELVLRICDKHRAAGTEVDQRWVSHAITHFQDGFMALNRSVFQPARVSGPIDLSFLEQIASPK